MSDKRAEILGATRRVIDSFTSQGFMFTALDVSNEVKRNLEGVRHRDVSPVVRALFEDGSMGKSYARTTIEVMADAKKVQALLYHDEQDDPDDYGGSMRRQRAAVPKLQGQPQPQAKAAAAAPAAAPSAAAAAKPTPTSSSKELVLQRDAEGRAAVPRSFLTRAGLTDDIVFLDTAEVGSGLVLTPPDAGGDPLLELEYEGDAVYIPSRYLTAFDAKAPLVAHLGVRVVDIEGRMR